MIFLDLFWTFFQIGLFTFGGGYAMLPMIQQEVLRHGWMTQEALVNFVAVSESTPGPFAINISTYVGAVTGGFGGALCSTLGVVLPSFVIILLVAKVFTAFQKSRVMRGVMTGLRPATLGLIAAAAASVGLTVLQPDAGWYGPVCAVSILAVSLFASHRRLHPILLILLCAGLGIAAGCLGEIWGLSFI